MDRITILGRARIADYLLGSALVSGGRAAIVSTAGLLKVTGLGSELPFAAFPKRRASGNAPPAGASHCCGSFDLITLASDGERCKTIENASLIVKGLLKLGYARSDTLVAIGGGTICDVAAFAASVFKRGMRLVMVPTTLLAMIDAAIGGKTAVNAAGVKNAAGTIHFPADVVVSPEFLGTLPEAEVENGIFEAFKYGLLFSRRFANQISDGAGRLRAYGPGTAAAFLSIIRKCAGYKLGVAGTDPLERGVRVLLNLGHTVGHAIESATNNRVPHGAAVGAGLLAEAVMARELGVCRDGGDSISLIVGFVAGTSALAAARDFFSRRDAASLLEEFIVQDKKVGASAVIRLPLLSKVASPVIVEVPLGAPADESYASGGTVAGEKTRRKKNCGRGEEAAGLTGLVRRLPGLVMRELESFGRKRGRQARPAGKKTKGRA